jgi:hypothetical protein
MRGLGGEREIRNNEAMYSRRLNQQRSAATRLVGILALGREAPNTLHLERLSLPYTMNTPVSGPVDSEAVI